ncbi:MAG: hypothetical protein WC455_21350 [Dehalococcoidia bacterium]|jgi:hypothetical protein
MSDNRLTNAQLVEEVINEYMRAPLNTYYKNIILQRLQAGKYIDPHEGCRKDMERMRNTIADLKCCGNCANFDDYGCKLCEEGGKAPNELCDEWIWDNLASKERKA